MAMEVRDMVRRSFGSLLVCLVLFALLAGLAVSCGQGDDGNGDNEPEPDVYALWKAQPNQEIVFMSKADSSEGELYLMDKSGQITRLTNNSLHENNPALSRDGKKVAFNAGDANNQLTWEIYVLDLETKSETKLTNNNVIDAHPDWSPDGSQIVFGSFRDVQGNPAGTADIYVMNADRSGVKRLTDSPWEDNDPEWSPDGTKIVFKSTRGTQTSAREEIYVMNSDGTGVKRLTQTSGWQSDHDPSWGPNSDKIVFVRYEGSRPWTDGTDPTILVSHWQELTPWNMYTVNLSGNTQKLTSNAEAGWGAVLYSSDGSSIIYGRLDWIKDSSNQIIGGDHLLILMNSDGSGEEQLIPDDRHTGTLEYFDW
jgi:Tol biopolymer transport system component